MEIINLLEDGKSVESWYLGTADSCDARRCQMVLDFLTALRQDVIGPRLYAYRLSGKLVLDYAASNGCSSSITLVIDWPDHGPLEDGLPRFHYRLDCTLQQSGDLQKAPRNEVRTHSVETACQFVRDAIERTRRGC